jgi:2-polyprenyl-3-methyl-5-hydroxy-6-metoxy-1,4-benzoquinol methylase
MEVKLECWCGNKELTNFSRGYLKCEACETLISREHREAEYVLDEDTAFYGRKYWLCHQEKDLGHPNIYERARVDLSERCVYWLKTLLKYKLPPSSILELGSGHGGFVALLSQAGFSATGLELSPWVVDFSRKTFSIPVLQGPLGSQKIAAESFDVIAMLDVLEHLGEPVTTMRECLQLLKPDGIILIQTPRYPENKTYDEMLAERHRFTEMLKEDEHIYLFSQRSIYHFFESLGVNHLNIEHALFSHYDMFVVASRVPIVAVSTKESETVLGNTSGGRTVQALIDSSDRVQELSCRLQESETDRTARLDQIHELTRLLNETYSRRVLNRIRKLLAGWRDGLSSAK